MKDMGEALPRHALGACGCGESCFAHEGKEVLCLCCFKWTSGRQATLKETKHIKNLLEGDKQ